jgi:ferrous iron transport protein B
MTPTVLSTLGVGRKARVLDVGGDAQLQQRLLEFGILPGVEVRLVRVAPLWATPIEIEVLGYNLIPAQERSRARAHRGAAMTEARPSGESTRSLRRDKHVVALLGNPNTGKSTLFTALTGTRQKIANYPGVTVEAKVGHMQFENTELTVIDPAGNLQSGRAFA